MTETQHFQRLAEAFSSHRFAEVYEHLAPAVRWVAIGASTISGRDDVVAACEQSSADLADTTTTFLRFRTVVGTDAVVVDAVARYTDDSQEDSVVSSCDIYEFADGKLAAITSYAAELDGGSLRDDAFIAAPDRH